MIYYESKSTDPCYNCALESYLWHNHGEEELLILWLDDISVVVGRDKNAFTELDMQIVGPADIHVVRRNTNGGTVFHDLGNLNFTLIAHSATDKDDFERFLHPIIHALEQLGIHTHIQHESELAINDCKISENAQKHLDGWVLHQGTLLFNSDLDRLRFYMKRTGAQIITETESSINRTVGNIKDYSTTDITMEQLKQQLILEFIGPGYEKLELTPKQRQAIQQIAVDRYDSWEWTFAKHANFKFHKNGFWKGYETWVDLEVKEGIIINGHVSSKNIDLNEMQDEVIGKRYCYNELRNVLTNRVNLFF